MRNLGPVVHLESVELRTVIEDRSGGKLRRMGPWITTTRNAPRYAVRLELYPESGLVLIEGGGEWASVNSDGGPSQQLIPVAQALAIYPLPIAQEVRQVRGALLLAQDPEHPYPNRWESASEALRDGYTHGVNQAGLNADGLTLTPAVVSTLRDTQERWDKVSDAALPREPLTPRVALKKKRKRKSRAKAKKVVSDG